MKNAVSLLVVLALLVCVSYAADTKVVVEDSIDHQLDAIYGDEDWEDSGIDESHSLGHIFSSKTNETMWDADKQAQIQALLRFAGDHSPWRSAIKMGTSQHYIENFVSKLKAKGHSVGAWFKRKFPKLHEILHPHHAVRIYLFPCPSSSFRYPFHLLHHSYIRFSH
jgi:hypothetical protein